MARIIRKANRAIRIADGDDLHRLTVDGSICKGRRFAKRIERNRHVADCVVLGGRRFLLCASAEQQERRKEKRKDFFHE